MLYGEYIHLSKRLKKKIQDICGLTDLGKDERLRRAREILDNQELKQAICNEVQGVSFKDIDRAMRSVVEERQPSSYEEDMAELEEIAPYKLQKEELFPKTKKFKKFRYTALTMEETRLLIEASNAPVVNSILRADKDPYSSSYSEEEVQSLLEGRTDLKKR